MRKSADDSMPGGLRSARSNPTTVSPVTKRVRVVRDATIDFRMMRRAYLARVHAGDVPRHEHAMQVSIWCSLPNTTECNGVLRVRCAVNTNFAM